jgi:hypothetical protein
MTNGKVIFLSVLSTVGLTVAARHSKFISSIPGFSKNG